MCCMEQKKKAQSACNGGWIFLWYMRQKKRITYPPDQICQKWAQEAERSNATSDASKTKSVVERETNYID